MYTFAEHQRYGVFMMESNSSLGLFWAMGTGKTATALYWVIRALRSHEISSALVVCPASLVANWAQALDIMANFEGISEKDIEMLKKSVKITSFQKMYEVKKTPIAHRDGRTTYKRSIRLRDDIDRTWGAVIVDESHGIGAHNSVQTRAAITLSKLAKHRFVMSATPTHGGGGKEDFSKLYGQLQFLSGGTMFSSWTSFCNRYVTAYDKWYKPISYDVAGCRKLMQNYAIVCRLEDCFDMPGMIEQDIPCKLAEEKMYKDIKAGNVVPYGIDITVAGGQYLKMLQICSGSMKRETDTMKLKTNKDDALLDILGGTDDPVVIFCNYRASIDRCESLAKKLKKRCVVFDGRSKGETWKIFQEGRADVLICQYQSGGCGLNLQRAHIMVMFEPCLSALLMEQAKGRIYRKGQNKKCLYYYLVTPGTMESKITQMVRAGVDINNQMLDDLAHTNDIY